MKPFWATKAKKEGFSLKNLFRNKEGRARASVEPADEKGPGQMRGETGTLRSVSPTHSPKMHGCEAFDLSEILCVLFPLPTFCSYLR